MKKLLLAVLVFNFACCAVETPIAPDIPVPEFEESCDYVICANSDTTQEMLTRDGWWKKCEWNCATYNGRAQYVSITWTRQDDTCYVITTEWETQCVK